MVAADILYALLAQTGYLVGMDDKMLELFDHTLVGGLDIDDGSQLGLAQYLVVFGLASAHAHHAMGHRLKGIHRRRIAVELVEQHILVVQKAHILDERQALGHGQRKPLRYSDFNFGDQVRTDPEAQVYIDDWIDTAKGRLNQMIAADCDGIVAGLYEDWVCYHPHFPHKLSFIPYPIRCDSQPALQPHDRLKVFIGINRSRSVYKGTDIMLRAAQDIS